jgi:ADP-heptose:LPS heptosyltransferase
MLESLRRSIGMGIARFHFRASREKVISFTHAIPSAGSLLVIMPAAGDADDTKTLLTFRDHFEEGKITVLTSGRRPAIERLLPRSRVIAIEPGEISAFFLPHRAPIEKIRAREYDLAVDLNLDFLLPSAYICRESNARVRVGFSGPHADIFYNFQVRLDPASQGGRAYERLVSCLHMFFAQEGV